MRISRDWLADFIDTTGFAAHDIAERLTRAGLEAMVEESMFPRDRVLVAEVLDRRQHPNADRLSVCTVSIGAGEPLTVVCGAPNIAAGQRVAFAAVGAKLPNGAEIGKAKIRGVASEGMILAEDELGISADHSGIIVLSDDAPVGTALVDYLGLGGERFEVELTPNRPDAMSHLGVARDLAALLDRPLSIPEMPVAEEGPPVESVASVTIDDPEGCPRYVARVVEGVKVGPSPLWLAGRLRQVALRPINNVVDATNYVLMALGHPLHAFDLDRLAGRRIVVRAAEPDEPFITLDGNERRIPGGSVMICDAERAVALGGIMGGLNSEITEGTTNVLLEAAYFLPTRIRRTSKALGLQTEASQRFERGADWDGVVRAIDWAASLIARLAGGRVARGRIDAYPRVQEPARIRLRWARIPRILGVDVPRDEVRRQIWALGIEVLWEDDEAIHALQPSWRPDLTREIDLVEEVARLWGYDRIPSVVRGVGVPPEPPSPELALVPELRTWLIGMGLQEVVTSALVAPKHVETTHSGDRAVKLANYSTVEMSLLRTDMLPSLLEVARLNFSRKATGGIAVFEIGYVYGRAPEDRYDQRRMVGVLMAGQAYGGRWNDPSRQWDYYDLRGVVETLLQRCSLSLPAMVHYGMDEYVPRTGARIRVADEEVGHMGQVRLEVCKQYDLAVPVFFCQLDVARLAAHRRSPSRVIPLPRYPAVERDLALVVRELVPAEELERAIRGVGGSLLERVVLFDVYRGKGLADGEKSLGFTMRFRSPDRTLTDQEVDEQVHRIMGAAAEKVGARMRT